MSTSRSEPSVSLSPAMRLAGVAGLFLVQFLIIGLSYKMGPEFDCQDNWGLRPCKLGNGAMISVYSAGAVLGLTIWFRPVYFRRLIAEVGHDWRVLGLNAVGFAIALIPLTFLKDGTGTTYLTASFAIWTVGFSMLLAGVLWYVAPLRLWAQFLREFGVTLIPLAAVAALAPAIATAIRPLWHVETLAAATFAIVTRTIESFGYDLYANPATRVIGNDSFLVNVAPSCSGIEGLALVTIFVTIYLVLFRDTLRFPRALWLYPIAMILSMTLNVVRIAVLLIIGLEGQPELAVGGFHSHAGWLMFTVLAVGIVLAAPYVPFIQKTEAEAPEAPTADLPPFFRDPSVAFILPFAVFMFSALLSQLLSNTPSLVYPLRVVAMAAAVALFLPVWRRLTWTPWGEAAGLGALIALMWVAIPVEAGDADPPYAGLTGALLAGWLVMRGIGTTIFVPIIEEAFFRGYLEPKIRPFAGAIIAALVSAAIFGFLHDRWVEAIIASLIFSWVGRRHGLGPAILCHAIANGAIFAYAVATGSIHII